jgi:cytochrome P450
MESSRTSTVETEHRTIYHEILDSKLPPEEKDLDRLAREGITQVSAGTMTTSWSISVAIYHALADPHVLRKLRAELESAIPDPSVPTPLAVLESLPYLRGVVLECLRLSFGVTNRIPRVAHEDMRYTDSTSGRTFIIPAGTPCSASSLILHYDEKIYPNAKEFRPERWVGNQRLERYMVSFSKGTRQCVGMNLGSAEIYLMIAALFRVYGSKECKLVGDRGVLELFETSIRDVEPVGDFQVPIPWKGSKGIRIRVLAVDD